MEKPILPIRKNPKDIFRLFIDLYGKFKEKEFFMDVQEAIEGRRSIRAYLDKKIPEEVIRKVLNLAYRAPSWKNVQAYHLCVVSGETKDRIKNLLIQNVLEEKKDKPDYPFPAYYPSYVKKRMLFLGKEFYNWLGIERQDKKARMEQMFKNFEIFGAPSAIFIFMEKGLEFWSTLDLGILVSHIMIAARSVGLETVAQASLAAYPDTIRQELNMGDNWQLALGMAIGYANPTEKVNQFHSVREPIDEITKFYW